MPHVRRFALLACVVSLAAACHRQAPTADPAPVAAKEDACWWTVYRSDLPVDTVAAHFVRAFSTLGLTDASLERQGDTAWTHAGPTRLASRFGATYTMRAIAFQRGDSTLYRYFVTVQPPTGGWRKGYDSVTVTGGHISVVPASSGIGLCAALASAVNNGGKAPRLPNGEEKLPVWSSVPGPRVAANPPARPPVAAAAPAPAVTSVTIVPITGPLDPAKGDSIVLERTPCFGICPPYRVRIARTGEVLYQSRARGDTSRALGSISAGEARGVFERAGMLGFEALPDTIATSAAYCYNQPTDFPSAITTIFVGGASKGVVDYLGCDWAAVGLRELEAMIDSVAATERLARRAAGR